MKKLVKFVIDMVSAIISETYYTLGNTATIVTAIIGVFIAPQFVYNNILSKDWSWYVLLSAIICASIYYGKDIIKYVYIALGGLFSPNASSDENGNFNNATSDATENIDTDIIKALRGITRVVVFITVTVYIVFPMHNAQVEQSSTQKLNETRFNKIEAKISEFESLLKTD